MVFRGSPAGGHGMQPFVEQLVERGVQREDIRVRHSVRAFLRPEEAAVAQTRRYGRRLTRC